METIQSLDTDISERLVVAGCNDSKVRLFAIKEHNLENLYELIGHTGVVAKACFINQGELIASSDYNGKLIVWKLEGTKFVKKTEVQVHAGPIYDISATYNLNEIKIYCACGDGWLKIVNLNSGLASTIEEKEIHKYDVVTVSSNEKYVATGGIDTKVCLISDEETKYFTHHKEAVYAVALSPIIDEDGNSDLATCSKDGKLVFIRIKDGIPTEQEFDIGEQCYTLDWSRTGFTLTLGYGNGLYKSYVLNENNEYEEIPMQKVEK